MERSQVPLSAILKTSWKMMTRPDFTRSMVSLQVEKQFFNMLYPQHNLGRANKIRQLSFRITDLCNLRCHTCGQWGDNGYLLDKDINALRKDEVSTERYIEQFHDLKKNGHTPILYFWGGEPMLYKGLLDLIDEGAKLGMPPTIATNGTNVGKSADRMVAAPMALIQISVDGSNPDTHNAARPGQKKSHDNFKDVIFACEELQRAKKERKQQLPLVVTLTTINRENYFDLVNIYERFRGLADMHIFYLSWWIDDATAAAQAQDFSDRFGEKMALAQGWVGDWNKFDYNVLSQQLKKLKQLAAPVNASPVYIMPDLTEPDDLVTYYTKHSERFGFDQCISIYQNPEIDSNGNLSPCRDYHDYVVGNIKDKSILELWNSDRYVKFRQSIAKEGLMPVCSRCCGLMGY
jgi:radical SAM protein with 4Fe4S-binding SPASM domain